MQAKKGLENALRRECEGKERRAKRSKGSKEIFNMVL